MSVFCRRKTQAKTGRRRCRRTGGISLTASFLAVLQVQACTSWTVTQEPLESIVESDETVRLDTDEFTNIELRHPSATSDTLYGKIDGSKSIVGTGLIQIPYSKVPGARVALLRSDIVSTYVYVYRPKGEWVEMKSSLDELVNQDRTLRIVMRNGFDLELTGWHADPDSLYGSQKRPEYEGTGWIAIPRSEIDQVAVHRTNVAASVGVAFLAVGALVALVGIIAIAADPLEVGGLGGR